MGARHRRLAGLAAGLATLVASHAALAAACCGDGGSLGQRLARDERAAATLSSSFTERFGGFDAARRYHGLGRGDHDHQLGFAFAWLVRPVHGLELGVSVPARIDWRSLGGASESGGGVGDVTALARFEVVPIDDTHPWPAVFVTTTVTVPTGRPTWLASGVGADVTGQGVPELRMALDLEKAWAERWFAHVSGSVGVLGPSDGGGVTVARSPRLDVSFVTGPLLPIDRARGVALGAGIVYEAEPPPMVAGERASSGRSRLSVLVSTAIDLSARVSLLFSIVSELPASGLGENDVASVAATGGVRFAVGLLE